MATAHWIVVGKVQGVGFRWFVREQARRWGVRGWVRNRPDGSVEIAAAGPEESLTGLLAAVKRGPEGAAVDAVQSADQPPVAELPEPFSILRG